MAGYNQLGVLADIINALRENIGVGGGAGRAPRHVKGGSHASANNFDQVPVQLVNPASNVNGAVIRTATVRAISTQQVALYIGTTAPTSVNDATAGRVSIINVFGENGGGWAFPCLPLFIPTGYGVWCVATGPNSPNNHASISYDIL
jgi:hypothetical protein